MEEDIDLMLEMIGIPALSDVGGFQVIPFENEQEYLVGDDGKSVIVHEFSFSTSEKIALAKNLRADFAFSTYVEHSKRTNNFVIQKVEQYTDGWVKLICTLQRKTYV